MAAKIAIAFLLCLALANALTYFENSLGKQRAIIEEGTKKIPANWHQIRVADKNHKLNLIIALKQRNKDVLEKTFWEVSDPSHPRYGKHLSIKQITEIVRPAEFTIKSAVNWLHENGIFDYKFNANEDFLHFSADVATLEEMFETEFHLYQHQESGKLHVTSIKPYSVPVHLGHLLDFVVGFNGFPLEPKKSIVSPLGKLQSGDPNIGPQDLRQRYNVTAFGGNPRNKQAVAEFQEQFYSPQDLQQFFQSYWSSNTNSSWWNVVKVEGENDPSNPGVEASLDIQYIMGVAPGVPTYFYSIPNYDFWGDLTQWTSMLSSEENAPYVHSISYGSQGNYPTTTYRDRLDTEFQKLGVRGMSIIFASGDSGTGCNLCWFYEPSFPATSVFVTSVGATHFTNGAVGPESAVTAFSSGGGMSWHFNIPSYQQSAVNAYFSSSVSLPDSGYYNRQGRGTPDVAALGIGFSTIVGGGMQSIGGTSASAPTFAAIVSLLNEQRLNAGKQPMGFLNTWVYNTAAKYPGAFYDVTQGNNQYQCCGTQGFLCYRGWDPVTGVGTPNYNMLKNLI